VSSTLKSPRETCAKERFWCDILRGQVTRSSIKAQGGREGKGTVAGGGRKIKGFDIATRTKSREGGGLSKGKKIEELEDSGRNCDPGGGVKGIWWSCDQRRCKGKGPQGLSLRGRGEG